MLRLVPAVAVLCLSMGPCATGGEPPIRSTTGNLPSAVDLRPEFERLGLVPRAQGARGTCSIFTACAAIEYAVARLRGAGGRLSPEFVNWAAGRAAGIPSDGNFFHHALEGFRQYGVCDEEAMPYRPAFDAALEPSAAALAAAARLREDAPDTLAMHWLVPWEPNRFGVDEARFEAILEVLARGFPVAAGSSHSRLLVGYRVDESLPGGGAFFTQDSALARFDEVTFDFVRQEVADAFWVEALPLRDARALTLADRGRSTARILVPAPRDASLDFAAQELQQVLARISGVELPILEEGADPLSPTDAGGGPSLLLGPSTVARERGLLDAARALGEDGVLIRSVGDDLVLLGGGPRGQVYVVYELLERYLGCRFLARDATVAPRRDIVTLPPLDHRHAPPFSYREVLCHDLADGTLAARLRLNGGNTNQCLGRPHGAEVRVPGIVISPFVHSAETMVPSGRWFDTHPEYFGLVAGRRHAAPIGGQLCYTNPDVLRRCTDWVMDWFAEHPEIPCVDVSQNDAWPGASGACECERCAAVVQEEGSQHGPILRFVNAIAAAVAERHPGRRIETLAYQHTLAAPRITRPRDDVVIRLCQHACYFHGIDCPAIGGEFRAALEDWRRVARNVYVWHYGVDFWSYLAPNPNLQALAGDLRRYARDGVDGVMVQCDLQSRGGELAELRTYLTAQLLWDPTRDPMEIRRDFCAGWYGPAQAEALEFLALMDEWGASAPQHIPMNGWNPPDVTPPGFVAAGIEVLERAFGRVTDPVHENHLGLLALPLWYLQLSWPQRYGLPKEEGAGLLARVRRVFADNEITTLSEGPPNAEAFLQQMEAIHGLAAGGGAPAGGSP